MQVREVVGVQGERASSSFTPATEGERERSILHWLPLYPALPGSPGCLERTFQMMHFRPLRHVIVDPEQANITSCARIGSTKAAGEKKCISSPVSQRPAHMRGIAFQVSLPSDHGSSSSPPFPTSSLFLGTKQRIRTRDSGCNLCEGAIVG